ncbi:uroporphyrinogen-III synthase [Candidatus Pseudothioglobus singularis]|uniref:Tetrapyrrole biosynthesis uroporphyrinogen III synthase domain-containing protein n=1 Tax=Candidatus Pseudothioglobus singularis PS1 TaxID=1125411 RepID=A0A0M5L0R6_9GAMM|nr:hypothetical protein [Candidatus Pseudothioglobus singularis]ALE02760.1 hypothetical protein W908_06795 [Candidatus Pseudothioglobus singularis PS1]
MINTRFPKSNIYNKWMILITRPISQTKNLELLLNNRNIDYALFPAFEIIKIQTAAPVEKYDIIIFISVNAVSYAEEHFNELFSDSSKVFAVGPWASNGKSIIKEKYCS